MSETRKQEADFGTFAVVLSPLTASRGSKPLPPVEAGAEAGIKFAFAASASWACDDARKNVRAGEGKVEAIKIEYRTLGAWVQLFFSLASPPPLFSPRAKKNFLSAFCGRRRPSFDSSREPALSPPSFVSIPV